MENANPTVVVVGGSSQQSDEATNSEREQDIALGRILEAHTQVQEQLRQSQTENENLRSQVANQGSELAELRSQVSTITEAIRNAAAEEEEAEAEVTAIVPVVEAPPEPEPERKQPTMWERIADFCNGV